MYCHDFYAWVPIVLYTIQEAKIAMIPGDSPRPHETLQFMIAVWFWEFWPSFTTLALNQNVQHWTQAASQVPQVLCSKDRHIKGCTLDRNSTGEPWDDFFKRWIPWPECSLSAMLFQRLFQKQVAAQRRDNTVINTEAKLEKYTQWWISPKHSLTRNKPETYCVYDQLPAGLNVFKSRQLW